jgi:hypothetical protein
MALVLAVSLPYRAARIRFVICACVEHLNLIPFTAHSPIDEDKLSLESGVIVQLNARVQSRNNDTVNVVHNKAVTGACFLPAVDIREGRL